MKIKRIWLSFVLLVACIGSIVIFFSIKEEKFIEQIFLSRHQILKGKKPINQKMGYMLYAYNSNSLQQAKKFDEEQIKVAKKLHAKYVRVFLETDRKYYRNDKYDLSFAKVAIEKIIEADMVPILTFSADRLTSQTSDNQYNQNISILKSSIRQAVNGFHKQHVIWESINEANSDVFWFHKNQTKITTIKKWTEVNDYLKMKVHELSPKDIYLSGAYATGYKETPETMLKTLKIATLLGMSKNVDAASIHPYVYRSIDGGRPESLVTDGILNSVRNTINKKSELPVIASEYGYNSRINGIGKWQGVFSENDKANNLVRETLLLDAHEVPMMIIYELEGSGFEIAHNGKLNFSGKRLKKMLDELGEYTFYKSISDGEKDDYLFEYRNGAKEKIVYWTSKDEHIVDMFSHKLSLSGTPKYLIIN